VSAPVTAALPPLADSVGPGGTAALVVFLLIIAVVLIFLAMLGSLRRLRQRVRAGTFNQGERSPAADSEAGADSAQSGDAVTRDPGPGGAGA
jgi:hypothetical protein